MLCLAATPRNNCEDYYESTTRSKDLFRICSTPTDGTKKCKAGSRIKCAKWVSDHTDSTDSTGPTKLSPGSLIEAGVGCGTQATNLGKTFSTVAQCAEAAAADASCGSTFQYPKNNLWKSWGCRCCVGDGAGGKANSNWSLYAVGAAKKAAA